MTPEKIDAMMKILEELKARVETLEKKDKENSQIGYNQDTQKTESIIEFYLKHNSKSDTDNALVLLSYLEKIKKLQNISSNDVLNSFSEAKLQSPQNISDKMQMLYKRGLVIRSQASNKSYLWQVSLTGEGYLEKLKNGK